MNRGDSLLSTFECEIKKVFGDRKIEFCVVDICEGLNTEDQWRNFNIIYDTISENEAVTVDITHGFRTIPMQLFSILNYARTLKNIAVA